MLVCNLCFCGAGVYRDARRDGRGLAAALPHHGGPHPGRPQKIPGCFRAVLRAQPGTGVLLMPFWCMLHVDPNPDFSLAVLGRACVGVLRLVSISLLCVCVFFVVFLLVVDVCVILSLSCFGPVLSLVVGPYCFDRLASTLLHWVVA